MMVVAKPAGLPVHASAKFYFNTLTRVLGERFPGQGWQICHRLDRETSGALVTARGRRASAFLKNAFAAHTVQKTYVAVVDGQPPWPDGTIDDDWHNDGVIDMPLQVENDPNALLNIRVLVDPGGQDAKTLVRVIERRPHCAVVRCMPVTGRQHQIRAHLAAVGFPIVGDKLYGHSDETFARYCQEGWTAEFAALYRLMRHALHAAVIDVPHPDDRRRIRVHAPLPEELRDYIHRPPGTP